MPKVISFSSVFQTWSQLDLGIRGLRFERCQWHKAQGFGDEGVVAAGWVLTSFFFACVLSRFSRVQLCAILWTVAFQAPLSAGFSREGYWSGLLFPPPGGSS